MNAGDRLRANAVMTDPGHLHGIAWDHPRAVDPLTSISAHWSATSDCTVQWDARPLKDFEDQPLEELAARYDLLLIDYPFVGFAASSGLIVPVDDWVDADYLADQARNSTGPSFASYTWHARQWALAIDAACQVSALRRDLFGALDLARPPSSWREVMALASALADRDSKVAMPLNPNHSYCAFLSVGVSLDGDSFWPAGQSVARDAARESLEFLKSLAEDLHPMSREADPIAVSDRMSRTDEIVYVPLMFGYSNYSRRGFRPHRLRFGDAPQGDGGRIGSVLGGVGIALSSRSRHPRFAAELARLIASCDSQKGPYLSAGGQPGHAAAWASTASNRLVDDFFIETRRTMDQAFLRPRVAGHREFQVLAGELIHDFVWEAGMSPGVCLARFDKLVATHLAGWSNE